jgi:hypothetical protein
MRTEFRVVHTAWFPSQKGNCQYGSLLRCSRNCNVQHVTIAW